MPKPCHASATGPPSRHSEYLVGSTDRIKRWTYQSQKCDTIDVSLIHAKFISKWEICLDQNLWQETFKLTLDSRSRILVTPSTDLIFQNKDGRTAFSIQGSSFSRRHRRRGTYLAFSSSRSRYLLISHCRILLPACYSLE